MVRTKKQRVLEETQQIMMITIGAIIAALGLELMLVPNNILDGGVIGLSIIAAELSGWHMSIFIVILNLPFLYIGFKKMGIKFALHTLYGVVVLSLSTAYLHHFGAFTDDKFLATILGSVVLGVGVGLVIKTGGALDGTEIIAILISKKSAASVGQIIMVMNLFIFILASLLVFSPDTAMYSIIAYFIAFKTIDVVVEGFDSSLAITIISETPEELADALMEGLGRGVTFVYGQGAYTKEDKKIIYTIVTRIELSNLRSIVNEIDPNALVAIEHINDISGSNFSKSGGH